MKEGTPYRSPHLSLPLGGQKPDHPRRGGSIGAVAYLDVECQLTAAEVGGFHPSQTRQRRLAVAVGKGLVLDNDN